jgi:hypothetical protein
MKIKPYAKAILAAAVAGSGSIATGFADGQLVAGEIAVAVAAAVAAGAAVFGVRNGPVEPVQ